MKCVCMNLYRKQEFNNNPRRLSFVLNFPQFGKSSVRLWDFSFTTILKSHNFSKLNHFWTSTIYSSDRKVFGATKIQLKNYQITFTPTSVFLWLN